MQRPNLFTILLSMTLLLALMASASSANQCSVETYGISTLRGDAHYPPGWDKMGGTLRIRHPFVQFHSDGSGLYFKGIEFEVMNNSRIGEDQSPNDLVDGALALAIRYLPPDSDKQILRFVPYTHIFEKGSPVSYRIHQTMYDAEPINSGYVRLIAEIPNVDDYIPAGAQDMALMVIYAGSFAQKTPVSVALGSYLIDPQVENHSRLAYVRQYERNHPGNIVSTLPDGDDMRNMTQWLEGIDNGWSGHWSPEWRPDGAGLAFHQSACLELDINGVACTTIKNDSINYASDIVLLDLESESPYPGNIVNTLRITDEPHWAEIGYMALYAPSFSPDGVRIAASALGSIFEFLIVIDANSGDWQITPDCPERIEDPAICDFLMYNLIVNSPPSLNPQDNTIAFTLAIRAEDMWDDDRPYSEIFLIQSDGSQATQLTDDNYLDHHPAWAPDGQWLAFVSNRDGGESTDIWMMDRSGNHKQKIYECPSGCSSPSFSPDGRRIAFFQGGMLKSMYIGSGKTIALSPYGIIAEAPSWSPYLDDFSPAATMVADKLKIEMGDSVTLSWSSANADKVVIDNGIGEQPDLSGTLSVQPFETTQYTLSAYNWAGRSTASVMVVVEAP